MNVKVVLASSDHQSWIRAKIQYYLDELSKFVSIDKNFEGKYDYPYLNHYWREPDRHPFIIYLNNEAVGFLLVREDQDPTDGTSITEISELYILPEFRQRSVASNAIKKVLTYFPGNWRAAVLPNNEIGCSFWRQLISALDPKFKMEPPAFPKNQRIVFSFTT
jgi:predicted acetyltransferase